MKTVYIIFGCFLLLANVIISSQVIAQMTFKDTAYSSDQVTAFRVRSDFNVELDEDQGWAAGMNSIPNQTVDIPFRIRFEVASADSIFRRQYSLQYRRGKEPWTYAEAQEFPYPSAASPPLSIVGCPAYFFGEEADDLLEVSKLPSNPGAGISLAPTTPGWYPDPETGASSEWEFALVVRRWADGPVLVEDGDRFYLRLVDHLGRPLSGPVPDFTVDVPESHLGGTFVETPAKIGPYENSQGELYFIMEPTETDNVFMMVKSTDGGKTWFEVDGTNRPRIGDLEGVGSVMSKDGVIHIVHQISEAVYHHAFATSDHVTNKDRWIVDSQLITSHDEPPTQTADITIRPDGSLVTVFAAGDQLRYSILTPNGQWGKADNLSHNYASGFTNPSVVCLPDGKVDIAYKSADGKGWHRQLLPDNTLTPPVLFVDSLGTTEDETIAILPLVYLPGKEVTVAVFRRTDGYLYVSHRSGNTWSAPVKASDKPVVTNAVDSEQVGADLVAWGDQLILSFIAEKDRNIYLTKISDLKSIPESALLVDAINGSWVRGNILHHQSSSPVYGLVYDAGSKGGSGFNKYIALQLNQE